MIPIASRFFARAVRVWRGPWAHFRGEIRKSSLFAGLFLLGALQALGVGTTPAQSVNGAMGTTVPQTVSGSAGLPPNNLAGIGSGYDPVETAPTVTVTGADKGTVAGTASINPNGTLDVSFSGAATGTGNLTVSISSGVIRAPANLTNLGSGYNPVATPPIVTISGVDAGTLAGTSAINPDGTVNVSFSGTPSGMGTLTISVANGVSTTPTDLNSTAPLSIAENQPIGAVVGEFNATDPDAGATLTYHLVGGAGDTHNSLFTLDTNGTLKTATTFDYESNASTYSIRVQVKDEHNASVEGNFTVTLTGVNEPPGITTPNTATAPENQTVAIDVNANDPDGDALTYSITGGVDQAKFDLNSSTGALTFKTAPDHSSPTDADSNNDYQVEITTSDGSLSDIQAITIFVNANPEVANAILDVTVNEDANDSVIDLTNVFNDPDDANESIGMTAFSSNPSLVTASVSAPQTIQLDGNSTQVKTYWNIDSTNWKVKKTFDLNNYPLVTQVRNQIRNKSGHAAYYDTLCKMRFYYIDGTNAFSSTAERSQTSFANKTYPNPFPAKPVIKIEVWLRQTSKNYGGREAFERNTSVHGYYPQPSNALTLDYQPDQNGTATVTVVAISNGQFVEDVFNLTVVGVNDPPTFSSATSATVTENQTSAHDVNANDVDGDTLTYSIAGGADQAKFDFNPSTGILTFKTPPDFEANASAAGNNSYVVNVRTSDGTLDANQTITVNVTDANDAPVGTVTISGTPQVGQTLTASNALADADGLGAITYQWYRDGAPIKNALKKGTGGVDGLNGAWGLAMSSDDKHLYATGNLGNALSWHIRNPTTGELSFGGLLRDGQNGANYLGRAAGIALSADGAFVYVVAQSDHSVSWYQRNASSGALTPLGFLKDGVNGADGLYGAKSITISGDQKHVYVCGVAEDAVSWFERNATSGALTYLGRIKDNENGADFLKMPTGVNVSSDGKHVYVLGENEHAVSWFDRNATSGALTYQGRLLDGTDGADGLSRANSLSLSSDGKHAYVTSFNEKAVSWFDRNSTTGALAFVGRHPDSTNMNGSTHVSISPDDAHLYVSSMYAHTLSWFERNASSGTLSHMGMNKDGQNGMDELQRPMQMTFSGDGKHAYVASYDSDAIAWFDRNASSGALSYFRANLPTYTLTATDAGSVITVVASYVDGGSSSENVSSAGTQPVNTPPTDLNSTAPLAFSENPPVGTVVGEFDATDPDAGATLTYHLVPGAGDTHNSLFTLETNGTLKTATTFDFESNASTYTIRVQAKDEHNATVEQIFTVTLIEQNEPPAFTNLMASASPVVQVQEHQTSVTTLTGTDPEGQFTEFVLTGPDAHLFEVNQTSGNLSFVTPPDFENPSDHDFNNSYELGVLIKESNYSAESTFLAFENFDYPLGDVLGRNGGTGWNGPWQGSQSWNVIDGNVIVNGVFATGRQLHIGGQHVKVMRYFENSITIGDQVGEHPNIWLMVAMNFQGLKVGMAREFKLLGSSTVSFGKKSNSSIKLNDTGISGITENNGAKQYALNLRYDLDGNTSMKLYAIGDNTMNQMQTFNPDEMKSFAAKVLQGKTSLNQVELYRHNSSWSTFDEIAVIAGELSDDNDGDGVSNWEEYLQKRIQLHTEKALRIEVTDQNDTPTDLNSTAPLAFSENLAVDSIIGEFNATHPWGDTLTYHIVSGVGDTHNALFTLETNGTLKTATTFDFESNASSYAIRVQVKDEFNATVEGNFTVTLTDVFEDADGDGFSDQEEASAGTLPNDPSSKPGLDFGLAGYWPLDGNASDMSGNGNHGILKNGPTPGADRHGIAGKAYSFDGVDDWLEIPSSSSLNFSSANGISIQLWANSEQADQWIPLIRRGYANQSPENGEWEFRLPSGTNGALQFATTTKNLNYNGDLVQAGRWHSFAFSANLITKEVQLFFDGNPIGTQVIPELSTFSNNKWIRIGQHTSQNMMQGRVDEVRIYNRALSANDIATLYQLQKPNSPPVFTNSPSATVPENQAFAIELNATDPDGDVLSYSIAGGTDASLFSLNQATRVLTFLTAPDYENPADANGDNSYLIIAQVSDGTVDVNQTLTVNVTDVYEAPPNSVPSDLNSTASLSVAENQPIGTLVGQFTANDTDANATLSYHLVSGVGDGNNSLFTLDANGTLKTATTFDFESNASSYSIRVQAKDEHNATVEGNFTVTLTDVYEAPPDQTGGNENNSTAENNTTTNPGDSNTTEPDNNASQPVTPDNNSTTENNSTQPPAIDLFRPVVETKEAKKIFGTSASLRGKLVDNGGSPVTERGFLLSAKPNPKPGRQNVQRLVAENGPGIFKADAANLKPGKKYFYRAFATNQEGTSLGSVESFTTTANPLSPSWIDAQPGTAANWWTSQWFGNFYLHANGWARHEKLGWVFPMESPTAGLWLWKEGMGWLWTNKGIYPFIYDNSGGGWLYFYGQHNGTLLFYDYSAKHWITTKDGQ